MISKSKLLLFTITVLLVALPPSSSKTYENLKNCDLACWLNFTFVIPNQSFTAETLNFTMKDMQCSGNHIGNINSTFIPPTSLALSVTGVGTTCVANFYVYEINFPYLSTTGTVSVVVDNSEFGVAMALSKSDNGFATSAELTTCQTKIQIKSINFTGGWLEKLIQLFESPIKRAVQSELDSILCTELSTLVSVNLTTVLQDINAEIIPYLLPQPTHFSQVIPEGMLNLQGNDFVDTLTLGLDQLIGPHGLLSLNKLVDRFIVNGSIIVPQELLAEAVFTVPISNLANLTLGITNISAAGLDTWGDVTIVPTDAQTLSIHTEMNVLDINTTFFINVSSVVNNKWLYEEAQLILKLADNNFNTTVQLLLKEEVLHALKVDQLIYPECVQGAIYAMEMNLLYFNTSVKEVSLQALDGDLEKDLDRAINNILLLFTTSFGPAIPAFFNYFADQPIRQEVNTRIEDLIRTNQSCPGAMHSPATFNEDSTIIAFSSTGAIFIFLAVILTLAQFRLKHIGDVSDERDALLLLPDEGKGEQNAPCLALDPHLAFLVRFGIPLLLLLNIGIFVSSNTSVGASIYMVITVGQSQIHSPSLFNFSLGDTIRDMWHAKVYPLAILIGVFSGAWPYLKLILMLVCWITPLHWLSAKRRETFLMALDSLGKWSLIDAFVLVLMVVAFRFHIVYPMDTAPSPVIDVYVNPDWGFYSFLAATMLSLALTHLILFYHNRSTSSHLEHHHAGVIMDAETEHERERRVALCSDTFKQNDKRFTFTIFGKIVIVLLLLLSISLVVVGSYLYSFNFEFEGAAAFVLEALGYSSETSYSVISLGEALPSSNIDPTNAGIRWIQATFYTFTVAIPLTHLVSLIFLWVTPLKPTTKSRTFFVIEIFNAWSALEVFVVSIIAAILEIQQFAMFIVGDKCDLINQILQTYFSDILGPNAKCFDVVSTLQEGCWTLFTACIIYLFTAYLVMNTCHSAIQQHKDQRVYVDIINAEYEEQKTKCGCSIGGAFFALGKALRIVRAA